MPQTTPPIHIIDDDEALRDSISELLTAFDFQPHCYASAEEFLARFGEETPGGCIVSDVCMPGMSGVDLMLRLRRYEKRVPVILITGHGDIRLAVEAMKAGAHDFLEKPFDADTLVDTVTQALNRSSAPRRVLSPEAEALVANLTQREVDVLVALAGGRPNKVIAHDLGISPRTVESYRQKLSLKLSARSTSDLVRIAVQAGLADPGSPAGEPADGPRA